MRSFLSRYFKQYEKRILLRFPNGDTKTYGEIWNNANLQAYAWRNMNVAEKPLLIQRPNSERWLIECLAAWRLGCQVVPLAKYENIVSRKKETNPGIISTENEFRILKDGKHISIYTPLVLFTSGSMGSGKPVYFQEENILSNLSQLDQVVGEDMICAEDISFSMLPWSHSYGLTCELLFLMSRGASLFIPDPSLPIANQIRSARPTLLFAVPYFLEKSMAFPDWFQYTKMTQYVFGGRLRSISVGGAFCSPYLLSKFQDMYQIPVYQGYGMTETSPMISLNTKQHNKIGTVGKPLPGVNVKILPSGEIAVSGKNVVSSLPRERYELVDGVQWLKTGDLGSMDKDGYLAIKQRMGDIFKLSNGLFVNAPKIEALFQEELKSSIISNLEQLVLIPHPKHENQCILVAFVKNSSWIKFWKHLEVKIKFVQNILQSIGKKHGLSRHEIPTDIILLREDQLKDFCTPKFTIKRHVLQEFIKDFKIKFL